MNKVFVRQLTASYITWHVQLTHPSQKPHNFLNPKSGRPIPMANYIGTIFRISRILCRHMQEWRLGCTLGIFKREQCHSCQNCYFFLHHQNFDNCFWIASTLFSNALEKATGMCTYILYIYFLATSLSGKNKALCTYVMVQK